MNDRGAVDAAGGAAERAALPDAVDVDILCVGPAETGSAASASGMKIMQNRLIGWAAIIAATALLVASVALLVRSTNPAMAQVPSPMVTGGENSWLSFTGTIPVTTSEDLYTVPLDRIFVVTGVSATDGLVDLYEVTAAGPQLRVEGGSIAMLNNGGNDANSMFPINEGRLVLEPGSTLRLTNDHTAYVQHYYLQGYLAKP